MDRRILVSTVEIDHQIIYVAALVGRSNLVRRMCHVGATWAWEALIAVGSGDVVRAAEIFQLIRTPAVGSLDLSPILFVWVSTNFFLFDFNQFSLFDFSTNFV